MPTGWDIGRSALFAPSSTDSANAASAPWARLRISSRDTEAIDGSASPRKPSVAMAVEIAVGNLRGRVALDRKREIVGVHAGAVVGDADQRAPARFDRDVDAPRAGVERVLDQLLDRRSRPLDHFAGGDAVDQQRIEAADGHGSNRRRRRA